MAWWGRCALLALVPVVEGAYTCPIGYTEKSDARCVGVESATCSDDTCCEATCASFTCWDGFKKKSGEAVADTKCTGIDCSGKCCEAITKCSDYTCPAKWKKNANADETACANYDCMTTCCTTTCGDHSIECKAADGLISKPSSTDCTFFKECNEYECCEALEGTCKELERGYITACSSTKVFDPTKRGAAANKNDWDATCCKEKPKCEGYTCPAGYELNDATALCSSATCTASECCKAKANTCAEASSDSTFSCPSGKVKVDTGDTYSSDTNRSDTKEAVCCKDKFACKDATNSANIDAGPRTAAPGGVALVLAAGAALVAALASSATL